LGALVAVGVSWIVIVSPLPFPLTVFGLGAKNLFSWTGWTVLTKRQKVLAVAKFAEIGSSLAKPEYPSAKVSLLELDEVSTVTLEET